MIEATTRGVGNIQRKTLVVESLFNEVADLRPLDFNTDVFL